MTNMYCETSDNYHGGTIPAATLNVYAKDVPGYVTDADAVYIDILYTEKSMYG